MSIMMHRRTCRGLGFVFVLLGAGCGRSQQASTGAVGGSDAGADAYGGNDGAGLEVGGDGAERDLTAPPSLIDDPPIDDPVPTFGSGAFGSWFRDRFGLPAFRYAIDEESAPAARQKELNGAPDAWHQVGNDHIVANAYNHGMVTLWSQDRYYQWVNQLAPAAGHFGGGYGYIAMGGNAISSLYDDRPAGAPTERDFGVGYARRRVMTGAFDLEEFVYAPFGDDPVLLHDVTLTNMTDMPLPVAWFEYWDVNPVIQGDPVVQRGLASPTWDPATRVLAVDQQADAADTDPLTIFVAAIAGPVSGYDTDGAVFFGNGGRAKPDAVVADRTGNSIAAPVTAGSSGRTMFAVRAPVSLRPGGRVVLRYAFGAAHRAAIKDLVARYGNAADPLVESERRWASFLPQSRWGVAEGAWLARELQWAAYTLRSGFTYEEIPGHHIVSQGGYYQYNDGVQYAYRDPLQQMLPMIYLEPELAREVIRYSTREQSLPDGYIPYGIKSMFKHHEPWTSNDVDAWLILAASEYGLATRDRDFFDEVVPYDRDTGSATVWEHIKLARDHQEKAIGRGAHGGYVAGPGSAGDWADLSTISMGMTESMLVSAQLAYIYPRLARVAERRGDATFAAILDDDAASLSNILRREWVPRGWYSRAYAGDKQVGVDLLYSETQPWAILAGIPTPEQAGTLVANIRRYLTGVGAPPEVRGPAAIGSANCAAPSDPDVAEARACGGVWYAVNGWLTPALGALDGVVPQASEFAWNELVRNTLAMHAEVFPTHWDGVISIDDTCSAWYEPDPSHCGLDVESRGKYIGGILLQPAWLLFDTFKLAGVEPTRDGYRFAPHLPFREFVLRAPTVGIAWERDRLRGYIRPEADDIMRIEVELPPGVDVSTVVTWANGHRVDHDSPAGHVVISVSAVRGGVADWAVSW